MFQETGVPACHRRKVKIASWLNIFHSSRISEVRGSSPALVLRRSRVNRALNILRHELAHCCRFLKDLLPESGPQDLGVLSVIRSHPCDRKVKLIGQPRGSRGRLHHPPCTCPCREIAGSILEADHSANNFQGHYSLRAKRAPQIVIVTRIGPQFFSASS